MLVRLHYFLQTLYIKNQLNTWNLDSEKERKSYEESLSKSLANEEGKDD